MVRRGKGCICLPICTIQSILLEIVVLIDVGSQVRGPLLRRKVDRTAFPPGRALRYQAVV